MSESPNTTGVGVLSTSRSAFSSKLWKSGQVGSASDRMGEAVLRFTTGVSVDVADGLGVEVGLGVEDGLGVDEGAVVGVEVGGTGVFVGPVVGAPLGRTVFPGCIAADFEKITTGTGVF